ncbi:uncharacterized protein LOC124357350 isoform X1 [Homalodisca vitripennis]|uniref:uncharacterized protein LOC124357350 isoform X1 n=1 Tax=Homalodisca vitripennis TaxID=197043 RepID=UPI001EEB2F25|nr:uncharacterized protein LOC124357350 isoform X1 [Homalodisca vitripennis]
MEEHGKDYVKLKVCRSELSKHTSSMTIPVYQVAELLRCGQCQEAPIKPPVYTCRHGHLTCTECRERRKDCHKCKEPLLGRNHVLEDVVRSLPIQTCSALTDCSIPLRRSKSEQSLQVILDDPQHLDKLERARLQTVKEPEDPRVISTTSLSSLCYYRASHRPVLCPFPCGRYVTCSGLFPHFEFYHSKVMVQNVHKERRYVFDLKYDDVIFTESRCQVFFVVHLNDNVDESSCSSWTVRDLMKLTKSPGDMLRHGMFISTLTVGRLSNSMDNGDDGSTLHEQFMTIWSTCLYHYSPVTYTLEVASFITPHSVSFTGPLTSLHYSQRPADVYARGECLLLTPGLLREMCFSPVNNLKVSITFHALPFDDKRLYDC